MRILIGVDGSSHAAAGVEFVRRLDLTTADEVVTVTVAELPLGFLPLAGPSSVVAWSAELRRAVIAQCEAIAAEAAMAFAGRARVSSLAVEGHPAQVLAQLAAERGAEVIVVGPYGRGRIETLLMGSVSEDLLHHGKTPIVVARSIHHGFQEVVLATDGSSYSQRAARLLAGLPLPAQAHVTCVTVVPSPDAYRSAPSPELLPAAEAEQRTAAERALDEASQVLPGSAAREIRTGDAKKQILELAEERQADLIVVGARGLGGFETLVLGSVSQAVAKAARCSVLVVHSATDEVQVEPSSR